MKILILRLNTSNFGKIGTYNVQEVGLANALKSAGHDVSVLFTHKKVKKIVKDTTYDFVYYLPRITFGLHGIIKLKYLDAFKPDRIILFSDNQLWSKNVIKWAKKRSIVCVNYFGNVLSDNKRWINQFYTKLILLRNKKSYRYSINYAKTNKVKKEMIDRGIACSGVIHVGLDSSVLSESTAIDDSCKRSLGYSKSDKILLFIGRLVDYKMPLTACLILKRLVELEPNYKLIIIGSGPEKAKIDNFIVENKLKKSIQCIERVPYNQIYRYMISSNCFINLSSREIFGMAILEAMYYKVPVIAMSAPGPNDIITNGFDGIIENTYDIEKWCADILEITNNSTVFSNNSRRTIETKFLWTKLYKNFIK